MKMFGTHLRDTYRILSKKAQSAKREPPSTTPIGVAIAQVIQLLVAVGIAWLLVLGVDLNLKRIGFPSIHNTTTGGFLWAITSAIIIGQLYAGIMRRVSFAERIAPYFGHRIYETYRILSSTNPSAKIATHG